MDDELRKAFATLSAQMSTIAGDVSANNALQKQTVNEVRQIGSRVERLEKQVFGSDPPPPVSPSSPVLTRITHSEGELAEMAGQIIAVKADVADLKVTQETQLAILKRLDAVAANPMVRRVAYAIGTAVLAFLAAKGWLVK
jgi:hypothetical protein